jgi:hypothetical protein
LLVHEPKSSAAGVNNAVNVCRPENQPQQNTKMQRNYARLAANDSDANRPSAFNNAKSLATPFEL